MKRQTDPTTRSTDSDPQPEDRRAPPNYRDRSSIGSIFLQIGQDFTELHHRFSCRHFPSSRQRWPDPPLADGIEQKRIRNQWAPARRRRTKLGYTRSRSVTSTVSPLAASRMYSLSLLLSSLIPTDLMSVALEPLLELGPSPFLSGRLPKSNARSASILVDELYACSFQGATEPSRSFATVIEVSPSADSARSNSCDAQRRS